MKKSIFNIRENKQLARNTFQMILNGDSSAISRPGQFINIALDGYYLRRPISVCDWDEGSITIIYKIVGDGTRYMSTLQPGYTLDVLSGLGNGFDTASAGNSPMLIGGGVGIPPLYGLAKRLGVQSTVVLGFQAAADAFYVDEFKALGTHVIVTTENGSLGMQGRVTDAMQGINPSHIYTCGPEAMLKAVYNASSCEGQYSFEERMGCGFGACMGCSCKTKHGYKRICKEGPVLQREEIIW